MVVEREMVTKMGVWMQGSRMEQDRTETVGLQEVMVFVGAVAGVGRLISRQRVVEWEEVTKKGVWT
jgi:hypothetical protein